MSSPEWWAKQPAEFHFLTTDKFGQMAQHTTRPTYNQNAGRWFPSGTGTRRDLGLRDIGPDFDPKALDIRPGYEQDPIPPVESNQRAPKSEPPTGIGTVTPAEHLISSPRTDVLVDVTPKVTSITSGGSAASWLTIGSLPPDAGAQGVLYCHTAQLDPRVDAILALHGLIERVLNELCNSDIVDACLTDVKRAEAAIQILHNAREKGLL